MKRIYLLMALLVSCGWLAEPCQAQKLEKRFGHIYSPLDKSEMTSGIFIQYDRFKDYLLDNNR